MRSATAGLDIPGVDAIGSYGAADFVSWFDGHPDVPREWPLDAASVAVIGNGNVALDVSRMLAKHAEDLLVTEIPANVYEGMKDSAVTDVHVFGRRGPAQVKFTPLELRELGELRDVDMVVYDEDFDYDDASRDAIASNKQVMVIDRVLQSWRKRDSVNNAGGSASRRLHLHFWARPVEVRTDDAGRVAALVYERTRPDGTGGAVGTGEMREVPIQALYRAVGYFGSPLHGVPFDKKHGVIPNREGQVLAKDSNQRVPGDLRDRLDQARPGRPDRAHQVRRDGDRAPHHQRPGHPGGSRRIPPRPRSPLCSPSAGVRWTDLEGWHRLDEHEIALGAPEERARIKVVPREEMVRISRGE